MAINGTKKEPDRHSMKEIKKVATVDVAKLQKQPDDLSKELREMNVLIQERIGKWKSNREFRTSVGPRPRGRGVEQISGPQPDAPRAAQEFYLMPINLQI